MRETRQSAWIVAELRSRKQIEDVVPKYNASPYLVAEDFPNNKTHGIIEVPGLTTQQTHEFMTEFVSAKSFDTLEEAKEDLLSRL